MTVDTEKYLDFVDGVTSFPSTDLAALLARATELDLENDCDVPRLLTAALGSVSYTHLTLPTKRIV